MDRGACPWGPKQLDTTEQLSSCPQAPELNQHLGGHFVDEDPEEQRGSVTCSRTNWLV